MLGQRCGNLKADIFFKHFCRLQDGSMLEVSSTNTRINASKIYKSFAVSFSQYVYYLRWTMQTFFKWWAKTSNHWRNGRQMLAKLYIALLLLFSSSFYSFQTIITFSLSFSCSSWTPFIASTYFQAITVSALSHVFPPVLFFFSWLNK